MKSESVRLCRSQLAVPANSPHALQNGLQVEADEVFIDLEDSIHQNEKDDARDSLIEVVRSREWGSTPLRYRINGVQSRWWYSDVIDVVSEVGGKIDGIILPKVRDPTDVLTVENLLQQVEVNAGLELGRIDIAVQIEDATGIGNVEEIAHATDRMDALIFGPGDYATSIEAEGQVMGADSDYPGHYWHYPLSRISHAAASANLLAIDGLDTNVEDIDRYRKSCRNAKMLGYDGKWVIHPDQTAAANEIFSPSRTAARQAKLVIETYEDADEDEIPTIEGKVIDTATVEMARIVLSKARTTGVLE